MRPRRIFIISSILVVGVIAALYTVWQPVIWSLLFFGPIILIGYVDIIQKKQSIRRNYPVLGNLRYMLEAIRPEIMQYFVETDIEGRPIPKIMRSLIYRRSKKAIDTEPFGTQLDVYATGYEWMEHSMHAKNHLDFQGLDRVMIGGPDCTQPYSASILNISAMSFGSLSKNAIMALNGGAKQGGFAHNTGEGGISPYHIQPGGDLIWQVGTGYFGCRTKEGNFNPESFKEQATIENVKMIEIKISQGAKPGHGGILPARKNTKEIAAMRLVEPHTDVLSPPSHTAFEDSEGLMHFIKQLRELSGGKPIGFKLCVGIKDEFTELCKAMVSTGISPDFISVDGGEGGTGAAPVEFTNILGMPLLDGLAFVHDTLVGYDLKKHIKLIAAGKIFSGYHIARALALGADLCNSARGMMLALGCIQSLQCNLNTCPVGVATQDNVLTKGLVVSDKTARVANFHSATVKSFLELIAAAGITNVSELNRSHINKRVNLNTVLKYDQIYPPVETGSLLTTRHSSQ
ncbi:MAG: FMN-binding glutamate synthase family protein [Bacteroidetes bacterium]|nr:MAG: FMN-binding glutamate synthase family protein [Bacteroidota bacterium]